MHWGAPAIVLLVAFWMHGYRPGPFLMSTTQEFLYYVVVFMIFSEFLMWIIATVFAKATVKILQINNSILMPIIFVCCVIGAFVVSDCMFDLYVMFVFGILGILMRHMGYLSAPFLLGIILGNMEDLFKVFECYGYAKAK
jgi:putative tricarboxylic transport membrane protein